MTPTSIVMIFFFNDTATTEIYTLSLHDALPISADVQLLPELRRPGRSADTDAGAGGADRAPAGSAATAAARERVVEDRKSTRLNSSHANISYAVFCLKKKKYEINFPHHLTSYYF